MLGSFLLIKGGEYGILMPLKQLLLFIFNKQLFSLCNEIIR
jgi:hypothetical protein